MKIRDFARNAVMAFGCSFAGLTLMAWLLRTMDGTPLHALGSLLGMLLLGSLLCAACISALHISAYIIDARVPPGSARETLILETARAALVIVATCSASTLLLYTLEFGSLRAALVSPQWLESLIGIAATSWCIGLGRLQQLRKYVEPTLTAGEERVLTAFAKAGAPRASSDGALTLTSHRLVFLSTTKPVNGDEYIPLAAIKNVSRSSSIFSPRAKLVVNTDEGKRTFQIADAEGWLRAIAARLTPPALSTQPPELLADG